MTESEAKKYMLIEKECINRDCNRDCANCDIVQDVEDLNNAYDVAINALKKQEKIKEAFTHYSFSGYKFDVYNVCMSALSEIKSILWSE